MKAHKIDARIETTAEIVCDLSKKDLKAKTLLKIEKDLPSTKSDQAEKFSAEAKEIISDKDGKEIEGCLIKVQSKDKAGDEYKTMK